jgi:hypothetical protein
MIEKSSQKYQRDDTGFVTAGLVSWHPIRYAPPIRIGDLKVIASPLGVL